jgi:hypothetical protein
MQDEDKALNEGTETSQPEAPTGESEEQVPEAEVKEEEVKTEASETSEAKTEDKARPSRVQRRIGELVNKLKEATPQKQEQEFTSPFDYPGYGQEQEFVPQFNYPGYGQEQELPIDPTTGEVDLEQLNRAVEQRAATIAELQTKRIISEVQKEANYRQAIQDWVNDLEKTIQESPELDSNSSQYNEKLDSALFEIANKVNRTEDGRLTPKLRVSEIWNNLKGALEFERSKAQGEVKVGLEKQIAEEAIRPGGEARQTYSNSDLQKLLAKDPAKVVSFLESRLPVAED